MQEEATTGVWTKYNGANIIHDPVTRMLTVTSTPADLPLHDQVLILRLVVTSVANIDDAQFPATLYLTVRFIDPCYVAYFEDHAGVTTPIEAIVRTNPHPYPIL